MSPARPDQGGEPPVERPEPSLEEVLTHLEAAVRRLSDQSAPLERLVTDWEGAQSLAAEAERRLRHIEKRLRGSPESGESGAAPAPDRREPRPEGPSW